MTFDEAYLLSQLPSFVRMSESSDGVSYTVTMLVDGDEVVFSCIEEVQQ